MELEIFLHKYEDSQQYGGPEEGGWWYNLAIPQWKYGIPLPLPKRLRWAICRWLNEREQAKEKEYGYTSVLSYREEFYSYGLETGLKSEYPLARPHYE